jgi:hypothetical protein
VESQRYRLGIGDGAHGPSDIGEIIVSDGGVVRGPDLPNWQRDYLLGVCEARTSYRGEPVHYVTLSPRHVGDSLADIRQSGGVVAVGARAAGPRPTDV